MYGVIRTSFRNFRTPQGNSRDRHSRKEHINRQRISPSFMVIGAMAEPRHTSILTSVLTSTLIFPVVGLDALLTVTSEIPEGLLNYSVYCPENYHYIRDDTLVTFSEG
jgi:hypothetical protein